MLWQHLIIYERLFAITAEQHVQNKMRSPLEIKKTPRAIHCFSLSLCSGFLEYLLLATAFCCVKLEVHGSVSNPRRLEHSGVLIDEVSVLRTTRATKVLYLYIKL